MNTGCKLLATLALVAAGVSGGANAKTPTPPDPGARELLAAHAVLASKLEHNAFGRPLVLNSQEGERQVGGDVYAVVDFPFSKVSRAFARPNTWCEVLILHLNTKLCRAAGDSLSVRVGRKHGQEIDDGYALKFNYALLSSSRDYLFAQVTAPSGPLGSRDYRIELRVVPLGANRSFLRLHYSYGFGAAARLATQGYLATGGSGKVGFTRVGKGYVRGMRGAIERNTMRYYLAIEAYLSSLAEPPGRQFASRIEHWFDATEQYRAQLHEIERPEYLAMKRHQYAQQQELAAN